MLQKIFERAYQKLSQPYFISDCLLCGLFKSTSKGACLACWEQLPKVPKERCPCCGQTSLNNHLCGRCQRDPPHFDFLFSAFHYDYPLRGLIQHYKYGKNLSMSHDLGQLLLSQIPINFIAEYKIEGILAIPLSEERLRERGFNQSLALAQALSKNWKIPLLENLITRTRHTERQALLPLKNRKNNVLNAFAFKAETRLPLSYQSILIVDDVATSGATLSSVAQILKKSGVKKVYAITLARALL